MFPVSARVRALSSSTGIPGMSVPVNPKALAYTRYWSINGMKGRSFVEVTGVCGTWYSSNDGTEYAGTYRLQPCDVTIRTASTRNISALSTAHTADTRSISAFSFAHTSGTRSAVFSISAVRTGNTPSSRSTIYFKYSKHTRSIKHTGRICATPCYF